MDELERMLDKIPDIPLVRELIRRMALNEKEATEVEHTVLTRLGHKAKTVTTWEQSDKPKSAAEVVGIRRNSDQ